MFYYSRGPHVEKIRPGCPTPPTRSGISNRTRTRDPLLYLGKAVSGTQTGHRRGQMGDRGVENTRRKKLVLQWTSVNGWWPTVWRREEAAGRGKSRGEQEPLPPPSRILRQAWVLALPTVAPWMLQLATSLLIAPWT
jgi:hypothetical protein